MQISHPRRFAIAFALAAVVGAAPLQSQAQPKFPSKPVRIVASTTPGSQPDGLARFIAQKLSEHWGVPVVMDNRPGAGGILAATMVTKAAADGYTLMYALPNLVISATMQASVPYDVIKDFAGVAHVGTSTNVLVAAPSLGVKSLKEFTALARSQPGKLILSTSAAGSAAHLSAIRFNLAAGIKAIHVAFKGGPDSMIEVLGGRAQYHLGTLGVTIPYIKEAKLTALAVTTPQRTPVLPDVPSLGEVYTEFSRPDTSHSILAPAGTPRAIIQQISKEVVHIVESAEMKERMHLIGFSGAPGGPEETDRIRRGQIEAMSRLVRDAGLKGKVQ